MNLFFHRFWSVVSLVLSIVVVAPAILAVGGLFLFSLAFLDYIPPDTTWLDIAMSPVGLLGIGLITLLLLPAAVLFAKARRSFRCSQLDDLMLERMETVRLRCADFYDEHGRAPTADDSFELSDLSATPYGGFPLILVGDREGVAKIDGKQPVVAPLAPWKSAKGWHSVLLLEDGEIKLLENYPQTRDFYRSLEKLGFK